MKDVKLYTTENCPFCDVVKDYIKENDLDVEIIDATYDAKRKREIMMYGGKIQVPMLLVDGKGMYESKDIVDWLKENM